MNPDAMTPSQYRIFSALASGRILNGQTLAEQLGLSRAAVWKSVEQLRAMGLVIHARAGTGYQLDAPVTLLDERAILEHCSGSGARVRVVPGTTSTNRALAAEDPDDRHGMVLVSEYQSQGRGRRERAWLSPPGSGLYLSMGWRFSAPRVQIGALGLVAGLAIAEAVEETAGVKAGLKWPNDLMVGGKKLGGCLVEISGLVDGPFDPILGIGINFCLPGDAAIDQAWTDLWREAKFTDRNRLAGAIIPGLRRRLQGLADGGFESQKSDWDRRDLLRDVEVNIHDSRGGVRQGLSLGVTRRGGLRVRIDGREEELMAGEVSIRAR